VISATGHSFDSGNGCLMEDLLQTDANINKGDSDRQELKLTIIPVENDP
jgi:S1-C subfamily serine protease